jgi:hypothetical protein
VARKLNTDLVLLGVTLALFGFGLVMVWSASSALAQERHGSPYYFLLKQVAWGTLARGAGRGAAARFVLRRPVVVYPLLIVSALLLIVVLFLPSVNGTTADPARRPELPALEPPSCRRCFRVPHRAPRRAHQRAGDAPRLCCSSPVQLLS